MPPRSTEPITVKRKSFEDQLAENGLKPKDPVTITRTALGWSASHPAYPGEAATARRHEIRSHHVTTGVLDLGIFDAHHALCEAHPDLWAADMVVKKK